MDAASAQDVFALDDFSRKITSETPRVGIAVSNLKCREPQGRRKRARVRTSGRMQNNFRPYNGESGRRERGGSFPLRVELHPAHLILLRLGSTSQCKEEATETSSVLFRGSLNRARLSRTETRMLHRRRQSACPPRPACTTPARSRTSSGR